MLWALGGSTANAQGGNLEAYADLKAVNAFGSIGVSLHKANSTAAEGRASVSEEELAGHLQSRAADLFPEIPFRKASPAELEDPKLAKTMAMLGCRIWIDDSGTPSVFQVRCQISTPARRNIIEDGSYGYGPADKVSEIVRQQIDHILGGFAGVFARLKSES